MLRFLTDQNFNGDILRGMLLRQPGLDVVRIQDEPVIDGADDPDILEWADRNNRIVLTHDKNTLPTSHMRGWELAGE
ncbi:MAG TPA: DUF5615 family PIN-like protein, partial [Tepidisphaeraceae bacterium]|nr:DUF5615 family PIN-like protein [Tepidisphaeraceae bacterium]